MVSRPIFRFLLGCCLCVSVLPVAANDVLPRMFTNVPVDTSYLILGYVRSEGNVAVDPALALDVNATLDTWMVGYSHAYTAFGQSALFTVVVPYSDLSLTGIVQGAQVSAQDAKMADPKFTFAFNLSGAPALPLKDFASYRQKTIIGFNIDVTAPFGDYQETRRVNFGSNRWTFSPEFGFAHRFRRFTLEGSITGIFFTDNDSYLVSNTLKQKPIGIARANLIYHFRRPGTWLGISSLYLKGGETSINGVERADLQANSRLGIALSVPFARRHNLLFRYSGGVTTRIGADFDNYALQYTRRF